MKLNLSVLDLSPIYGEADPLYALNQSVALAKKAEDWGYARYWVAEHHDMPKLASSCPEVFLAHIGAHTSRIRIGSGAVLLPYYKPYKVAEAFFLLATLHPGRIDLGIGRAPGGSAHVSLALSSNFLEQVGRMPDLVKDLSALLANEFMVEGQPVQARPIPPIPPELWLLGTNRKSAEYAARNGAGYVFGHFMSEQDPSEIVSGYRRDFQPSRLRLEPKVILAVSVVCADTKEQARQLAAQGEAYTPGRQPPIAGDPGEVTRKLQEMARKYQTDEFMVITPIPDYAQRLRSYELLARSVFGQVRI